MIIAANINSFLVNQINKRSCTLISSKFNLYKITTRSMKSMARNGGLLKETIRQERLSDNLLKSFKYLFSNPIENKTQVLDRTVAFCYDNSIRENITKQTILKGLFPRVSFTKINMLDAIKANSKDHISQKLKVEALNEKSDPRFILEVKTASELLNTSENIKSIIMNSERPSQAVVNTTGSNKYPDLTVNINTSSIAMDVKSGDNKNDVFGNVVAEVSYDTSGDLYTIMNKGISLEDIQKVRMLEFKQKNVETCYNVIQQINALSDITVIKKNILIQEEIFKYIVSNPNKNFSLYFGTIVTDSIEFNYRFHQRLSPFFNDDIFNNKKEFQKVLGIAFKIYHEEVNDVFDNIQKSKGFWMGTGFEHIANDIFN